MFYIIVILAAIFTVPAKAQEKVAFPSTDADLKGGTPTTITVISTSPQDRGLLRPSLVCMGVVA